MDPIIGDSVRPDGVAFIVGNVPQLKCGLWCIFLSPSSKLSVEATPNLWSFLLRNGWETAEAIAAAVNCH
jgi:hypothetical protein